MNTPMNKYLTIAAATLALASCTQNDYKLTLNFPEEVNGETIVLTNFDTGDTISTAVVQDKQVVFEGSVETPTLVRGLIGANSRSKVFVLEPGEITYAEGAATGTPLNTTLGEVNAALSAIQTAYYEQTTEEGRDSVYKSYNVALENAMAANTDNVIGFLLFLNGDASQMDAPQLREQFEKYPSFAGYERAKKLLAAAENREATQVGGKFIDFSVVQPDGKEVKLSDYVGNGKYTLVDFWASWCGPCIRQTAVIKDIQQKYANDERLQILGVAVWDEVEATLGAIEKHGLTWPCIVDAQSVPTDLYGITGIPCIILFGPDGTILSRDKQDDELRADVDAALAK